MKKVNVEQWNLYAIYTLSQKNDTNSNAYTSYMAYLIFLIFCSNVLGECRNIPAKFQAIWWSR